MDIQIHVLKEMTKHIVESNPNFPDWVKTELKIIIDAGKTPQEVIGNSFAFLATISHW